MNYVYTIFFITIMVAHLYTIFHEFTPGLLVLRLEETAIGAGVGFLVALLLMPMSTRDTGRSARRTALANLAKLCWTRPPLALHPQMTAATLVAAQTRVSVAGTHPACTRFRGHSMTEYVDLRWLPDR